MMLWYYGSDTLKIAIDAAARYYEQKYGAAPTICLANPEDLDLSPLSSPQMGEGCAAMAVVGYRRVQKKHLMMGLSEEIRNGDGCG